FDPSKRGREQPLGFEARGSVAAGSGEDRRDRERLAIGGVGIRHNARIRCSIGVDLQFLIAPPPATQVIGPLGWVRNGPRRLIEFIAPDQRRRRAGFITHYGNAEHQGSMKDGFHRKRRPKPAGRRSGTAPAGYWPSRIDAVGAILARGSTHSSVGRCRAGSPYPATFGKTAGFGDPALHSTAWVRPSRSK